METTVIFAAICILLFEVLSGEPVNNIWKDFCFAQKEARISINDNVTTAFEGFCREATSCVLPARFYKVSCAKELLDVCNIESTANFTRVQQMCCGNLSSYRNRKEAEKNRICFRNISVDWNEKHFWPVRSQEPLMTWEEKRWAFLLKMASQKCLNESKSFTPSSVKIKYQYPIFTKQEYYDKKFVQGFHAPSAYLVMMKGHHDLIMVLKESAKHLWVTVIICITWTLISGVIIWLLDRRSNPFQFPTSFWEGVREGIWWAVVTMTTVGYGDKSPRSLLARIYAAIWMIIGMIILSIFTADVSSVLTAREMIPQNSFLGRTIGVPVGSKHHFSEEFRGGRIKEMNSYENLMKHLKSDAELHRIVLHTCVDDDNDDEMQITRALERHIVGIKMNVCGGMIPAQKEDLVKCVRHMIEEHPNIDGLDDKEDPESEKNCDIEMREHSKMKGFGFWDSGAIILYASVGVVAVIFVAGSAWDICSRGRKKREEVCVESRQSMRVNVAEEPIGISVTLEAESDGKK